MESISSSLKRFLRRRRRYQTFYGSNSNKRKLKVIRLGGGSRRLWKLRTIPKLQWKLESPVRALVNFHEAYVDMMIRIANGMGNLKRKGLFGGKKIAKERDISMVFCGEALVVDTKLVLEIYKSMAASHTELRGSSCN
ncbi:hypothetical protein JCGZ_09304 [Jatropha curcas]|uniref:Uncharacterized protein n=1 Tax=Jatropha curcas TaxID=180498 RepID=A0A067KFK3_JATCU|nr:uncharacterized protein LOC105636975 [Jatropha curcas]KDP35016.1 hypothetical protein JCGZ_09304 [Jatropha curcas]